MSKERKRRGDAFEAGWSASGVEALRDGLLSGWTYEEAKRWVRDQGQAAPSNGALHSFWEHYCAPVLSERRRAAAVKAEEIARLSREDSVDWSGAAMERLQQVCFEFLLDNRSDLDSKAVARLMRLVLLDRALGHDERKLQLLEEKAHAAETAKRELEETVAQAKEGGISEDTLRRIEEAAGLL